MLFYEGGHMSGGGGTTSTMNTVTGDPVYNAGLLELMRGDAETAKEYDNFFRYGVFYDPNEPAVGYYDDSGKFTEVGGAGQDFWTDAEKDAAIASGNPGAWYTAHVQGKMASYSGSVPAGSTLTAKTKGEVYGYDPEKTTSGLEYATMAIQAQADVLPAETSAYKSDLASKESVNALSTARNEAAMGLIPGETELAKSTIDTGLSTNAFTRTQAETETGYYPEERAAAHETAMATSANDLLEAQKKNTLIPAFFDEAMNYDVEGKVNQAGADAVQAFKNSGVAMRQRAAQTGINPASGTFQNAFYNEALDKTRAVGTARVQARENAEKEKFNRLTTAYNI
jgi:hypothetical protein